MTRDRRYAGGPVLLGKRNGFLGKEDREISTNPVSWSLNLCAHVLGRSSVQLGIENLLQDGQKRTRWNLTILLEFDHCFPLRA